MQQQDADGRGQHRRPSIVIGTKWPPRAFAASLVVTLVYFTVYVTVRASGGRWWLSDRDSVLIGIALLAAVVATLIAVSLRELNTAADGRERRVQDALERINRAVRGLSPPPRIVVPPLANELRMNMPRPDRQWHGSVYPRPTIKPQVRAAEPRPVDDWDEITRQIGGEVPRENTDDVSGDIRA